MSLSRGLLILSCLQALQACSTDTAEAPSPVTVSQDGTPLQGMTDLATQFGGAPGSQAPVTLTFRARFDPIPQAADDEYILTFSVTFPDGSVLAGGNAVDLSAVPGLTAAFDQSCFCLTTPYAMAARGSLALQAVSQAQMTGALEALFTLTDPLKPGPDDLRGRTYSLRVQSFVANPTPAP